MFKWAKTENRTEIQSVLRVAKHCIEMKHSKEIVVVELTRFESFLIYSIIYLVLSSFRLPPQIFRFLELLADKLDDYRYNRKWSAGTSSISACLLPDILWAMDGLTVEKPEKLTELQSCSEDEY